jgi:hypothetical protein
MRTVQMKGTRLINKMQVFCPGAAQVWAVVHYLVVAKSHSAAMTSELATWNRTNMTSRGMLMERPSSLQSRCYR